ncbi:MAG TPA: hypothetical protein VFU71_00010 [Burkholderiaceae bacterium]|nr:hypothetical protein [Burkholderiaceae bacterium]
MSAVSRWAVVVTLAVMAIVLTTARRAEPPPGAKPPGIEAARSTPVGAVRLRAAADPARPLWSRAGPDGGSLGERVERLQRGAPRERYQAFALLARCAHAIDFDRYLKSLPSGIETVRLRERYGDGSLRIATACGDLSARQVEQRVELAASAADDGIPGAASAWIEEGPFGDQTALTQRPDDPLIVQWAEQAIARVNAATRRSDTEAISQFGMLCLNWEMDDVARVRLLVDAALQQRREDQIRSVLN